MAEGKTAMWVQIPSCQRGQRQDWRQATMYAWGPFRKHITQKYVYGPCRRRAGKTDIPNSAQAQMAFPGPSPNETPMPRDMEQVPWWRLGQGSPRGY